MTAISQAVSHFEPFVSTVLHQPGPLYIGVGLAVFVCYMIGFSNMARD